jgi:hypothetical protein
MFPTSSSAHFLTGRAARRRASRSALPMVVAVAASLFLPFALSAQQASASLTGRVISATGETPLGSAGISVLGSDLQVLSDRDGRFRIADVPAGEHVLEFSSLGHQTLQMPVDLASGTVLDLDVRLAVAAVEIEGVAVTGRSDLSPEMQGFHTRMGRGYGTYFTAEQIATMRARTVTDVLQRVPGAEIRSIAGPFGSSQVVQMGRAQGFAGARDCSAVYFLNGMAFPVPGHIGINAFIRADEIDGMEVYTGASRIPAQFNTGTQNSRCGVVVIWTRSGPLR